MSRRNIPFPVWELKTVFDLGKGGGLHLWGLPRKEISIGKCLAKNKATRFSKKDVCSLGGKQVCSDGREEDYR